MNNLNFTPEQRQEYTRLAQEARIHKKQEGKHLKQGWADENFFRECASKIGFRLAPSYISSKEVKYAKKVLKAIDRDIDWWYNATGYSKLTDFYESNPLTPAFVMQGIMIETYLDEIKGDVK